MQEALLYALAKGVPGALGLLAVVVFIRLVGSAQFGIYAIVLAAVGMWSSFASGWFYQSILRYYSGWRTTRTQLHGFLFRGIVLCVITFIVAYLGQLVWGFHDRTWGSIGAALFLGVLIIAQTVALSCWQSELLPGVVLRVELVRALATFGFSCVFAAWISNTATSLLTGAAVGYVVSFLAGRVPILPPSTDRAVSTPSLTQAWLYGWPLSFWFLAQLSFAWLDRVMIEDRFGLQTTGLFASLSEVLTRSFSMVIYPLTIAAYPRLATAWNQGKFSAAKGLLRRVLVLGVGASVVVVALLHYSQAMWIGRLLPHEGPTLLQSAPFLVLALAAGGAIWQLALLAHKPLELQSRTGVMLAAMLGALLVKIAGNRLGLTWWGITGPAGATVVAGGVYAAVCLVAARFSPSP